MHGFLINGVIKSISYNFSIEALCLSDKMIEIWKTEHGGFF